MPSTSDLCQRIHSSIRRVVEIRDFSCSEEDGKAILKGQVSSRDEALMCAVVARLVPGVASVTSEVKVSDA